MNASAKPVGHKGIFQMCQTDEDLLKAEIDEIMRTVDAIMDKVARVIPKQRDDAD